LNIEQQNKEPQNHEVVTSIFDIPCSIFCGLKSFSNWCQPAKLAKGKVKGVMEGQSVQILPGLVYDGFVHSFDVVQVSSEEAAITEVVDVTRNALGTCVDGL
jgi:hypothetical protein